MAPVRVVTGFIPIPNHPRAAEEYKVLGGKLLEELKDYDVVAVDQGPTVAGTWLAQQLQNVGNVTHSVSDNPDKNTLAYHCVQHEKFAWLRGLVEMENANGMEKAANYVWIDYGILHVPGVTGEVLRRYLDRADSVGAAVTIPGCWPRRADIPHDHPCWRFCGGLFNCPRPLVKPFTTGVLAMALRQIHQTRNVEWEVNSMARFELTEMVPMAWYQADHNETMFTGAP